MVYVLERYKLIHFYNDIDVWELYDLQADPTEMHNLYGQKEYESVVTVARRLNWQDCRSSIMIRYAFHPIETKNKKNSIYHEIRLFDFAMVVICDYGLTC